MKITCRKDYKGNRHPPWKQQGLNQVLNVKDRNLRMWIWRAGQCNEGQLLHTVSFDWFLSSFEWILTLEFCLLKFLIFYHKLSWNIRSRLNSSTFWVFEHVFKYVWSKSSFFLCTKLQFSSNTTKYRPKNSKGGWIKHRANIP